MSYAPRFARLWDRAPLTAADGPYYEAFNVVGCSDVYLQWVMEVAAAGPAAATFEVYSTGEIERLRYNNPPDFPLDETNPYWTLEPILAFTKNPGAAKDSDRIALENNAAAYLLVKLTVLVDLPKLTFIARCQGRGD